MNHAYRLVWNERQRCYVPAAETARARRKGNGPGSGSGGKVFARVCAVLLTAAASTVYPLASSAGPTGGEVVSGQGSISQGGNTTTISQQSQNLSLNWQQFNIASSETVQFVQPSSSAIALNRVIGNEASQIYGRLSANGRVFLVNPNGVLFAPSAQVDVGGLVASTLNISESDFLAGHYQFSSSDAVPGSVVNQGSITASSGGSIALLGGHVSNQGTLRAELGTVALAAGRAVTLDFSGTKLMDVQIDESTLGALAENRQLIQADGGTVIMTAAARDALLETVVNNTGVIEARTVQNQEGVIKLLGSFEGGTVNVSGTLDASAPNGGDGGFIETSGAHVTVTDTVRITAAAPQGTSGLWLIDPSDYTIGGPTGNISAATLSAILENNNVWLETTQDGNPGNGDIHVDDIVTWSAAHTLTLTAIGDVNVNAAITNTGSPAGGGVTLRADRDGACVAGAAACGTVNLNGAITAETVNIYYNPAGSNAAAGANGIGPSYATTTDYSGNVIGTLNAYMLVNDVNQLQAIGTNLGGSYALGRNIDASATSGWNSNLGFDPIGDGASLFTGVFDGLGSTISNLTIARGSESFVGLFARSQGTVRNVTLDTATIVGDSFVGALVGWNEGTVYNSLATASVQVTATFGYVGGLVGRNYGGIVSNAFADGPVSGNFYVGGLVGVNENSGRVTISSASGSVTGTSRVGGLVGDNTGNAEVSFSSAFGTVNGAQLVGGLVGQNVNDSVVDNSSATGNVTGTTEVGGLVGRNDSSTVSNASASGRVQGETRVGGLVGTNLIGTDVSDATVTNSSATGNVIGVASGGPLSEAVGGLVGTNDGTVTGASFATGNVEGEYRVGGLIGENSGSTSDVHATGQVTGVQNVGGLVGYSIGSIADAAATGAVSGEEIVGGLVGTSAGTVSNSNASGAVSGATIAVGGLMGLNDGIIGNVYATGSVSGGSNVGGLVGINYGTIDEAHATGTVSAQQHNAGGLVGASYDMVTNAYATGTVSGDRAVGGLIGLNDSLVGAAWSTGTVSGNSELGALIGSIAPNSIVDNVWYNADLATINGAQVVMRGALYDSQFQHWLNNGLAFDITAFATSLPFDPGSNSYLISNLQGLRDLLGFANVSGLSFQLTADIDLAGASGFYIPEFLAARFDGAGHTIANLDIDMPVASSLGLFGYVGATSTIANLSLVGGTVTGNTDVGALVGLNEGTISNSSAAVSVFGSSNVGGLVGFNLGTINTAYATGSVTAQLDVAGGLVGFNGNVVTNAHATGPVSGNAMVGGLIGFHDGILANSYATGSVSGTLDVGGLTGSKSLSSDLDNAWYNVDQVTINGAHAVTVGALYDSQFQDWLANGRTLDIADYAASLPFDADSGFYLISTVQGMKDLLGFATVSGLQFQLTADIDLATAPGLYIPEFTAGEFNGGHHTIANLMLDLPYVSALGLFGRVGELSTIVDVILAGGTVTGNNVVGALVGWNEGTIRLASATASVTGSNLVGGLIGLNDGQVVFSRAGGSVAGTNLVGGLVGVNQAWVFDSSADASVSGADVVGGLIGLSSLQTLGGVTRVHATGSVTGVEDVGGLIGINQGSLSAAYATGSVSGTNWVGGLIGYAEGVVTDVYAAGAVSGADVVGGLVGGNAGEISDAYATGAVEGDSSTGGLLGVNFGTVNRTYATGLVAGEEALTTGGLVGFNDGGNVYNSFWDIDTTGQSASDGGNGLHTTDFMSTASFAATFDLNTTWFMVDGDTRPFLRSEYSTFITNAHQLQLMALDLNAIYSLANDIDMSELTRASGLWNTSTGFLSVGDDTNPFAGTFDGDGHTITGLVIHRPDSDYTGLFGASSGGIFDVGLIDASVTGRSYTGALVGQNAGNISDSYSSGTVTGHAAVGGLVGRNLGSISEAYAAGSVSGAGDEVGGLVGRNDADIDHAHATAQVSNTGRYTGGLIGGNYSAINDVFATGNVVGASYSGGLVGINDDLIVAAYATGTVSGGETVGGLAGRNVGTIRDSYASGAVSGTNQTGGLVGSNQSVIADAYATGAVAGSGTGTGGLVGENYGSIRRTYSTGRVTGDAQTGGLVGFTDAANGATVSNSFWDMDTSEQDDLFDGRGTGKTSAEMRDVDTFSGWSIAAVGGSIASWRIYEGYTNPLLRGFMTGTTVAVDDGGSTTYNGADQIFNISYDAGGANTALISTGTASYRNAGSYNLGRQLYSSQQGYDISYVGGTLDIARANLTISSSDVVKTYDGTTSAAGTAIATSGLVGGDTLSEGTFAFADKNAGTDKAVTVGGVTVNDGNGGNNYNVTYADNTTSTIERANLSISSSDVTKTYDGTTSAAGTAVLTGGTLFGGDTLSGGTFAFVDRNAGTDKAVTVSGVAINDGNGGNNYSITYADNTTSTIAQRALTYTTVAESRVYDGTTAAVVNLSGLTGLVGNETLTVTGTGAFNSKDVGSANLVTVTSATLGDGTNGGLASNYTIAAGGTAAASITPRALTYTTTAPNRVYDGTTNAVVNLTGLTGLVGNETLTVSGTGVFNSRDVATANRVTVTTATLGNGANGGLASNYSIAAGGTAAASITPASLTITAENASRQVGALDPAFNLTYRGFVAGETATTLTTLPTATTNADSASPAGRYAITVSGAVAPNYSITYVPGTLTVTDAYSLTGGLLGAMAYLGGFNDELFLEELSDGIPMASETHDGLLTIQDSGMRLPAGVH